MGLDNEDITGYTVVMKEQIAVYLDARCRTHAWVSFEGLTIHWGMADADAAREWLKANPQYVEVKPCDECGCNVCECRR